MVTMSSSDMVNEIRHWLLQSGLTAPSLARLEPELPEWADRLQAMGVTEVLPPTKSRGRGDNLVNNYLKLWVEQAKPPEDRDLAK